jgi:hypothetical protein
MAQEWIVVIKLPGDGNMVVPSVAIGRAKQAETKREVGNEEERGKWDAMKSRKSRCVNDGERPISLISWQPL